MGEVPLFPITEDTLHHGPLRLAMTRDFGYLRGGVCAMVRSCDCKLHPYDNSKGERIFIELMTSDRKLKASREGSK